MATNDAATVLVVDDEADVADSYADQLRDRYDVATAYSGTAALETLDASVDVVLLDRRMPDRSGDEALAAIRERGYDTRVAMVTAVEPDFDILDLAVDDYVVKPVSRSELVDTVERLRACATYERELGEFYALAAKHAALSDAKHEAELAASDRFRELEGDLEDRRARLEDAVTALDDAGLEVVLRNLGRTGQGPDVGVSSAD